jgi:hypothetical protein
MLARLVLGLVAVASLGWAVSHAFPAPGVPRPPVPAAKSADGPLEFQVKMHDDSQLSVLLLDPSVTVVTKYGRLVIPAADVRRIEPGFRYAPGVEERVNMAIDDLGSPEFRTREDAEGVLISLGAGAVPGVRRATKSADAEVVNRANAVLKNLRGKLPADALDARDHDVVDTTEFTARGRIEATQVKVRTKHFGEASLPLADIRTFASARNAGSTEVPLDAALYGKSNNVQWVWLETNIDVQAGQSLDITATGQVDLNPAQAGQFLGTPAGNVTVNGAVQNFQPGQFGGTGMPGQVVGRVGPAGTPFVIGAAYKGKVAAGGKLFLRIAGSPWNNDSSGTYTVKVTPGWK